MARKSDEKRSFKLYNDYRKHFEIMTDEEAGKVIKAIFAYVNNEDVQELDGAACMALSFIEAQLDRDREAYDRKCEVNKENGTKGGRPRKKQEDPEKSRLVEEQKKNPQKPNALSGLQKEPDGSAEIKQEKKRQSCVDYPDDFNTFWEVYPRTVGKKEAYDQYIKRLKNGYRAEQLIAAAKAYRAEMERRRQPKEYILHPKTFLGVGGRFEEYIPKAGYEKTGGSDGYGEVNFREYV